MPTALYLFFAHLVVIAHLSWILFLIFGFFLGAKNRYVKYLHISGWFFALFLAVSDLYCPLTYLEQWLRKKAGAQSYEGSFIIHYLEKIIYIELPPDVLRLGTLALFLFNMLLYTRKGKKVVV